ncbi:tyrosine-type recombinase/integrase [Streptomyces rubellomurinus]|uniref:Integrase n=1 Tax=Streptomyces rubellomurinus (strain ATCC 31215) TaxID=359131 RepID=A0A0F2T5J7_STRR3|nr:site-specific integrase [Streptomyces rubellomurinus]KJS58479.1 integrase [Streptomyces rubellomurinus]
MANSRGNRRRFGSVRQLASGRWQIRYADPVTGLMRPGEQTYPTKTDADVALTLIEADIKRDRWTDPDAGSVKLNDFAVAWLRDRKLEESTRERYAITLRQYIEPGLGHRSLAEITPARVRSWRSALLENGAGEPSVVKAYQLLRAIMNTALDDELIQRNPCRIKGADTYDVPERPVLSITEVFAVANAIGPRWRALVLLTAFTTLRFGELAALRRRDVDLANRLVRVQRNQAELNSGRLYDKAPKSRAGFRPVAFPAEIVDDLAHHLDRYAGPGPDGHLFIGPRGGKLRRSNFRDDWIRARTAAGVSADAHFHDLRHTGNTLASQNGASTRELMTRMGHSSTRAALIYQHMTSDRDRAIADRMGEAVREALGKQRPAPGASGTQVARPD